MEREREMSAIGKKSPFGAYDIRGVFGENLTEAFAQKLGVAIYKHIGVDAAKFALGHDVRSSSPLLCDALAKGIVSAGGKVTMLGVSSTPRVYWHGAANDFDCSVAITASHLPAKHNGFKLCRRNAVPISSEDGLVDVEHELKAVAETSATVQATEGAVSEDTAGFEQYICALKKFFNVSEPIKIVVDAGGSPVGNEVAQLFEDSKVTVVPLGFAEDPSFSRRSANPIDEGAVDELASVVIKEKARFGAAFDGDGDRVVFVDERGALIDPDLITALLAERVLAAEPGRKVMFDLRSSRAVKEHITGCGGEAVKSRVGHSFIKADMRKQDIAMAGELSAHYYWSDLFYTDNAVRALIEMTNLLSQRPTPLSELVKPLQRHSGTGEINFKTTEAKAIIDTLKSKYADGAHDFTDGLTVEYDEWWFNVRTSQTEPVVRLCVGAVENDRLQAERGKLESIIQNVMKGPVPR
jgi:phosphomannomutase